jgi:hypothetical protein
MVFKLAFIDRPDECNQEAGGYKEARYNQNNNDAQRIILHESIFLVLSLT